MSSYKQKKRRLPKDPDLRILIDEYEVIKHQEQAAKQRLELLREKISAALPEVPEGENEISVSGSRYGAVSYLKRRAVIDKRELEKIIGRVKFRKIATIANTELEKILDDDMLEDVRSYERDTTPSLVIRPIDWNQKQKDPPNTPLSLIHI